MKLIEKKLDCAQFLFQIDGAFETKLAIAPPIKLAQLPLSLGLQVVHSKKTGQVMQFNRFFFLLHKVHF